MKQDCLLDFWRGRRNILLPFTYNMHNNHKSELILWATSSNVGKERILLGNSGKNIVTPDAPIAGETKLYSLEIQPP
jgi:hypothetical protein